MNGKLESSTNESNECTRITAVSLAFTVATDLKVHVKNDVE